MKTTAELEKEIAQLKHIVFTLRGYVLVLHRQTMHNKIGKREHTTDDLHEINMIN